MLLLRLMCLLLVMVALSARADVLDLLAARQGMAGEFTQEIFSSEGVLLERSSGEFALLRPRYLRWEIESPDRQLLIASDGRLTQVDWDLEVVVERQIPQDQRSPFDWLLASRSELEAAFSIEVSANTAVLTPYDPRALYQRLDITYEPAAGWQLRAEDRGGQVLNIELSEDRERPPHAADFVVPDTPF